MRARQVVLAVFVAVLRVSTLTAQVEISRTTVIAAMNAERAARHLPPLHEDPRLDAAAGDRIRDMLSLHYWAHVAPDGRTPFDALTPRGYVYLSAAENLAAGFDSLERLIAGWMGSSGHRENILSAEYEDCGVAILDGNSAHPWRGKSVVVLFGRARR
jgi:uncharacterized protein YkwD